MGGAHRITIDIFNFDLVSTSSLDVSSSVVSRCVIQPTDNRARRRKGCNQQSQQQTAGYQRRPDGTIKHATLGLKVLLSNKPQHTQGSHDCTLSRSVDRASNQDLSVFPDRLGEERGEGYIEVH